MSSTPILKIDGEATADLRSISYHAAVYAGWLLAGRVGLMAIGRTRPTSASSVVMSAGLLVLAGALGVLAGWIGARRRGMDWETAALVGWLGMGMYQLGVYAFTPSAWGQHLPLSSTLGWWLLGAAACGFGAWWAKRECCDAATGDRDDG